MPPMRRLVVALPARNAAAELGAWFAAVEPFADAVVALDDGSTDDTAAVLAAHPLTAAVLRNPTRPGYAGWDDRANRQALLDACEPLAPDWVLQLDADERLVSDDALALRHALDHDGLDREMGYLLQVLRAVDTADTYDQDSLWVGRLFAYRPGLELPTETLHLVPLPTSIPRERRVRSTLRIVHLGSATPERRAARVAKYREADPANRWQADYAHLAAEPDRVRDVAPRPPLLPVVRGTAWPGGDVDADTPPTDDPLLSVVVISGDDEDVIERSLSAIQSQVTDFGVQVIVVTSGTDTTAAIVRAQFPGVELVVIDHPALPGEARNAGLARARGRYITFPGSHIELVPGSLAARVERHREGWAMVAGNVHNGTATPAGWATYFLDHARSLPARPSERLQFAPGACSYLRAALEAVGGFPEDLRAGEDTAANNALFALGYGAFREQHAAYIHHSRCRTGAAVVRHHHQRGRGLGTLIVRGTPPDRPLLTRDRVERLGLRYVPGRFHRTHFYVWRDGGRLRWRWLIVSPISAAAIVAAWAGAWREILRPGPGALDRLAGGTPGGSVLARSAARSLRRSARRVARRAATSAAAVVSERRPVRASGPAIVFVAAGHGGDDRGTEHAGIVERDLNAAVATVLVRRLRDHGLTVATDLEHGNPTFPAEAHLANELGAAYYLAIHHNHHDSPARGVETFGRAGAGAALARSIVDEVVAALRTIDPALPDRGVRDDAGTGATKHLDLAPGQAVVVELCFLSSDADRAIIDHDHYAELAAEAMCRAVVDRGRDDGSWTAAYGPAGSPLPPLGSP
jgi:N-acetylmuramoyl-L-alanine amidase